MSVYIDNFRELSRKAQAGVAALVLTLGSVIPLVLPASASAIPSLANRKLEATTAVPAATGVTLKWTFDTTSDTANIKKIEIEFCDSPLSSCTNVDGSANSGSDNIPIVPASPTATLTGFTTDTVTATTRDTNGRDAGASKNNQITIEKTNADAGASLTGATIEIGGFTNDNNPNVSYYTRVRFFSDNGTPPVTRVWEGVFAQSTSQTLTVNARVQERLDFCVGSTTVNDATTSVGAACSNITGTNVDIGNVESGFTNVSPVSTTNGGSNTNGVAMVRTNAVNGVVVDYKTIQETSSGKLKVTGATCSGTSTTDQCFNSAGTTQVGIVAGTESFGMAVAGVNCGSNSGAYTCNFAAGTYNLIRDNAYDGDDSGQNNTSYVSDANQVSGTTTNEYAWDDTGTADRVASSAGSTVKVVDDEALILKFAATAGITTPTGAYTVQSDFIATATF